jgi:hypothetical protein
MNNQSKNEFFIGWEGKAPEGIGKFVRGRALMLLPLFLVIGAVVASQQGAFTSAAVDGTSREFTGVLISDPVPMLVAQEPDDVSGASVYLLANPMKAGFDLDLAKSNHLKGVSLKGALIYSDSGQAMIEVVPDSLKSAGGGGDNPLGTPESLGEMTLQGEIVDSKCYLGKMNPGHLKTHRACAIICISGGIPPVLFVQNSSGAANYFLLTDENGKAINDRVLDMVALPVEITGTVERMGKLLVLKASPASYRRLD